MVSQRGQKPIEVAREKGNVGIVSLLEEFMLDQVEYVYRIYFAVYTVQTTNCNIISSASISIVNSCCLVQQAGSALLLGC